MVLFEIKGHFLNELRVSFKTQNTVFFQKYWPFYSYSCMKTYHFAALNVKVIKNCSSRCNKKRNIRWSEAATRGVLWKKVFLEISQNSQENTCARVSFLIKFIKKETLAQVFSCEFCEISKNTFFTEHLWETDSGWL